jgi:hypothetical protein
MLVVKENFSLKLFSTELYYFRRSTRHYKLGKERNKVIKQEVNVQSSLMDCGDIRN